MINMRKKNFMNYCGLLGIVALLSYTVAVVFSPLDYPGYNWMAQAVSDLSASNAPSLGLWNQLSSLYNICTLICAMMVCAGIQGKGSRLLRSGIYLFTAERSIQPMAARIVAEETERMIIATKQLFYAMEVHKLFHFENADMSAVSFAMTIHGLMDYGLDQKYGYNDEAHAENNLIDDYLKWFCKENSVEDGD